MENDGPTCAICLVLVTQCRRCPQCRQMFCSPCIYNWLSTSPSCPTCRFEAEFQSFDEDREVQAQADQVMTVCEYGCGSQMVWGERLQHTHCATSCPCPYAGCGFKGSRKDLDLHIVTCRFSGKYSLDALLKTRVSDAQRAREAEAAVAEQIAAPVVEDEDDSILRHFVMDSDTLAGLCIKYDTDKQTIRRLNKFSGENIQCFESLKVPRPQGFVPKPVYTPTVEVLIALRKKKLTRRFAYTARVSTEEAVTYLSLNKFDLDAALKQLQDDQRWEARNPKPQTLHEFVNSQARRQEDDGVVNCNLCQSTLDEKRGHCPCCGVFFCSSCLAAGGCAQPVAKRHFGVTSPHAADSVLNVCAPCHRKLIPL